MYLVARFAILICALCASAPVRAQPMEGGARTAALGGAGVAFAGDAWSRPNPAGRGPLQHRIVAFFGSQGYGMAELRLGAVTVAMPTGFGTLALGGQTFGFEEYRESIFFAGYARGLQIWNAQKLYGGVDLRLTQITIPGYGSLAVPSLSVGLLAQVLPDLWVGVSAADLSRQKPSSALALDKSIAFGFMYVPDARVRLLADTERGPGTTFSFLSGVEIWPVQAVAFRAGIGTAPARFTVGAGLRTGILEVDAAAQHHDVLGWTPGIALEVTW